LADQTITPQTDPSDRRALIIPVGELTGLSVARGFRCVDVAEDGKPSDDSAAQA